MGFVLIKAHEISRDDLKVISALTKESMQDALKRILAEEKARVLSAEQAKSNPGEGGGNEHHRP